MKDNMDWTIERGEESFEISIKYDYKPGTPDGWIDLGDPPEVELESVTLNGVDFPLTDKEVADIEQYICENPPEEDDPDMGFDDD